MLCKFGVVTTDLFYFKSGKSNFDGLSENSLEIKAVFKA